MTTREKLASIISGYRNYLKHGLPFLAEETATEKEAAERLAVCNAPCENKRKVAGVAYCRACFCPLEIKARSKYENCIIWDARRNLKR